MKPCTFCGQEISPVVPSCPFCNRAQPTNRIKSKSSGIGSVNAGRLAALVVFATVAAMAWTQKWKPPESGTFVSKPKPAIFVTATRHPHGIEITNRETELIAQCVVRIPEQWSTVIPKLAPSETATVTWTQFRNAAEAEMSAAIGQNARYAHFECASHKQTHRAAALPFR